MYLEHYGLIEKPFSLTPDPKYFFASGCHAEARDLLRYGVREREGFMCFVGAAGTGKTTLLRTVLESFGDEVVTALVLNPFLSEEDLLRIVLIDLGAATRQEMDSERGRSYSKQQLIDRLNEHLMRLSMDGKAAVLVIDEAQNLPMPVMEQIRLLSNLETSKSKLLQIVLAGQLGLRKLMQAPELSQLAQRVSVRYTLQPLGLEEIARYIEHRLRIAGSDGELHFDRSALTRIHEYSEGVPRLVNLICDRALLAGYAQRTATIDADIVDRAAETLDLAEPGSAPVERDSERTPVATATPHTVWQMIGAGAALAAVLLVGGWAWSSWNRVPPAVEPPRAEATIEVPALGSGAGIESAEPAAAEAATTRSVELARPSGEFTVYLSSFRSPEHPQLRALRLQMHDAGHRSYVLSADVSGQGVLHRLVVGDFSNRIDAEDFAASLRGSMGLAHAEPVAVADVTGS